MDSTWPFTRFAREDLVSFAQSFGLSIGVHVVLVLLIIIGTMNWKPFRQQQQPVGLTIEAVIVDTSELREQREAAQRAAAEAEQRRQRQERRARELEAQRQREEEQQRQREVEAQQRQQIEEERRRKEAENRLQQLRLERERKLEEERLRQQRELEQVRQQREAAEKQRKIEEERLKQLDSAREAQAAEQRRQQEAAEQKQRLEAEQKQAQAGRIATLEDEYKALIQRTVTQNWLRPPTARPGLRCTLRIVQIPGGEVISAAIAGSCNGDEVTRRSIIAAVERVGTLPYRGYEDVFKREIEFNFIYDGD